MLAVGGDVERCDAADGCSVLFITRKYPPAVGGMEEFSARLFEAYPGPKGLVAWDGRLGALSGFVWDTLSSLRTSDRRFDVVHLGDGLLAAAAGLAHRLSGAPIAVTVHGQEVTRDFPGYPALLKRGLRTTGPGLVAVSQFTAGQVAERYHLAATVIANGVNLDRFARIGRADRRERLQFGLPAEGELVVLAGRLVRRKGAAWFIREVAPALPEDVTVCVVGDGPERENVWRAAAGQRNVRLLGRLPDDRLDQLYGLASLFVAPNIAVPGKPEGFGLAPAEAAAAGLPVLVADIEGLADMAAEFGLRTVPSEDGQAWVAAVRMALADADHARATRQPRGWHEVGMDYARFFQGLAGRTGSAGRPAGRRQAGQATAARK